MSTVELVLVILMLSAVSALVAPMLRGVPLPLVQIAVGVAVSWPQRGLHVTLDPELFLMLLIPPLLFADGWRIPKREFFALRWPILTLAFGLVFFTVFGLGYFAHWLIPGLPLTVAFALAAVLSPTDAVSVQAITRGLGMPANTQHILDGESLLNDASGLVALKFAVAATLTGSFSWLQAGRDFLWMAAGGLLVGWLLGLAYARLREAVTARIGELATAHTVTLLLLLPFAAYIGAEQIGASGILAAVAAGVTTNFSDLERGDFIAERVRTQGAWSLVESSFNGAVFLLLGLQLPGIVQTGFSGDPGEGWRLLGYGAALSAALIGLRALWLTVGVRNLLWRAQRSGKLPETPSPRLLAATAISGIRGAVTLAAALSIPLTLPGGGAFPARDTLVFIAATVIVVTLVLAAVLLPWLLAGLPAPTEPASQKEERQARLRACQAAIRALQAADTPSPTLDAATLLDRDAAVQRITADYRSRINLIDDNNEVEGAEERGRQRHSYVVELTLRLQGLHAERAQLYRQRRANLINDDALRALVSEIDMVEISLRNRLKVARRAAERAA